MAALKQQLACKGTEADGLSRKLGALNRLSSAFEQVRYPDPSHAADATVRLLTLPCSHVHVLSRVQLCQRPQL